MVAKKPAKATKKSSNKNLEAEIERLRSELEQLKEEYKKLNKSDEMTAERLETFHKNFEKIAFQISFQVDALRNEINAEYVSKDSFEPIKLFVYGLIGAVLLAVIAAILKMIGI